MSTFDTDDFLALVKDIGGAGVYASGDLYRWYVGMMEEQGREPVSQHMFSTVIKALGLQSETRSIHRKTTRCWRITNPWARRAQSDVQGEGVRTVGPLGKS